MVSVHDREKTMQSIKKSLNLHSLTLSTSTRTHTNTVCGAHAITLTHTHTHTDAALTTDNQIKILDQVQAKQNRQAAAASRLC